ncbi:hypothetical protein VMCG_10061 [Cytospora schulzeri]|uniref:Uncharacterized protein n=1 Tax=Cytospora schulzeri TaxID=448051 RepID=A0A423VCP7_9PEZI|nr:hypothetical protein VMCG_10061 [Valsa malicola]
MPPENSQQAEMRSPTRAVDEMDDSVDLVVEDAPLPREDPINESSLIRMFGIQQQQLKMTIQEELDKRLPHPATGAPTEKSHMLFGLLNQVMGRGNGNQNPQEAIEELLHQTRQLQQENQSLRGEVSATRQQNQKLTTDITTSRRDLSQERAKNQELTDRMTSLRQMLVPPPEDQISDTEIIQRFTALRSLIFRLVRSTWDRKLKDDVGERDVSEGQCTFFGTITNKNANWKTLYNRLRYFVFYKLSDLVLGRRLYGLGKSCKGLDKELEAMEFYMWDKIPEAERRGLIMDWRLATMKVTGDFRDDQHSLARAAYRHIWDFLSILETNSPDAEQKGKQMLEQICNDAVDLAMLMRRAKDGIYVDNMGTAIGRPISEWETFVEEEASEASDSSYDKPQTIAYVLTGALVKHPKENPREKKVLEKAQVAVYQ